jgi:hypothetical protein
MIRELRTYNCVPGKLPDLVRRFDDHTRGLFDKHGIRYSDFWVSTEDPNQLIYFLIWDDMAERETKFPALLADPAWHAVRDASEANGPITTTVTDRYYSPLVFAKPGNHLP